MNRNIELDLTCPECKCEDSLRLFVTMEAVVIPVFHRFLPDIITFDRRTALTRRWRVDSLHCLKCGFIIRQIPAVYFKQLQEKGEAGE